MNANEKRQLVIGAVVGVVAGFLALRWLQSDGVLSATGQTVNTPAGLATVGQLVLSLLIALGGFVLKVGGDGVRKLFDLVKPPAALSAGDIDELKQLESVVIDRLRSDDADGVIGACDLYRRIKASNAGPLRGQSRPVTGKPLE